MALAVCSKRKGKMADDNVSAPKTHKMALDKEKAGLLDYASTLAPFWLTNTLLNRQQTV